MNINHTHRRSKRIVAARSAVLLFAGTAIASVAAGPHPAQARMILEEGPTPVARPVPEAEAARGSVFLTSELQEQERYELERVRPQHGDDVRLQALNDEIAARQATELDVRGVPAWWTEAGAPQSVAIPRHGDDVRLQALNDEIAARQAAESGAPPCIQPTRSHVQCAV